METKLSPGAVFVLRLRARGDRMGVNESSLSAFQELVDAGIMEPLPGPVLEFRFTEEGWVRREECLEAAEADRLSLLPSRSDRVELSEPARELIRRRLQSDDPVTASNRPAYHELMAAGIMVAVSGFASGPEASFRFTDQGWARRHEWATLPAGSL